MKKILTHNERYSKAQDLYYSAITDIEKEKYFTEMYHIAKEIATNYIRNTLQKTGVIFDQLTFDEKVEDAVLFVMKQYFTKPDFRVDKISAYMHFGKLKSLYGNKEQEQNTIAMFYTNGDGKEIDYEDDRELDTETAYELYDTLSRMRQRTEDQEEVYQRLKWRFENAKETM